MIPLQKLFEMSLAGEYDMPEKEVLHCMRDGLVKCIAVLDGDLTNYLPHLEQGEVLVEDLMDNPISDFTFYKLVQRDVV